MPIMMYSSLAFPERITYITTCDPTSWVVGHTLELGMPKPCGESFSQPFPLLKGKFLVAL